MNGVERRLDLRVMRPLNPASNDVVAKIPSWAKAMAASVAHSGLKDKSLAIEMDIDAAQFSKMVNGQLGVMPEKLFGFMDACGTELALMWLNYQRGYDIEAMRHRETELQRELREATERAEHAEAKLATAMEIFRGQA